MIKKLNGKKITSLLLSLILIMGAAHSVITADASESLTEEVSVAKHLNKLWKSTKTQKGTTLSGADELPESYKSVQTPVKNQGFQGTCWIFSAMANMEIFLLKNGYGEYDLSEEHTNWWAMQNSDGSGWVRKLGDGGYSEVAMGYLASWQGPKLESDIPYSLSGTAPKSENFDIAKNPFNVTGIMYVNRDEESVKRAIMEYGSVSASYNADTKYESTDKTAFCSKEVLNPDNGHAICIVGWDDNYSRYNFNESCRPKKNGAWYVKNSWGDYNSLGGYFWLSYEDYYLFSDLFGIVYTVTDVQEADNNTHLYQRETYGATYIFPVYDAHGYETTDAVFVNLFDFTEEYSNIDKIIFQTECAGAEYTAYYIPTDSSDTPTEDTDLWTELSKGTVPYSGYICDDIDDYTVDSGKGAIGIKLSYNDGVTPVSLGVSEWMTDMEGEFLFYPGADYGVSYIIDDNGVNDIMEIYAENGDYEGGQLVIKAVSSKAGSTETDTDTSSDTSTDTETDTGTSSDTSTDTETDIGTSSDTSADTETDTDTSSDTSADTETDTGTSSDISTDTEADSDKYELGDVNLDKTVDMQDVVHLQRFNASIIQLDSTARTAADLNHDGEINMVDVVLLQRKIARFTD